jgi:4-amino-4-deoxy-L-arabinose transferase-like glycosyltransferase
MAVKYRAFYRHPALILFLLALLFRWAVTNSPPGVAGRLPTLLALDLACLLILLSFGIGRRLIHWLGIGELSGIEQLVLSVPLGFGVIGYALLGMSLAGLLQTSAAILLTLLLVILTWKDVPDFLLLVSGYSGSLLRRWRQRDYHTILAFSLVGAILLFALIQALTPPWAVDELIYHLTGPKAFIEAGKIVSIPDFWLTFNPFHYQMLYTYGMLWGSDVFARLVHLASMALLILATYGAGNRFLRGSGWLPALILVGTPIFPMWGSVAYVDFGWALYEFLSLYLLVRWVQKGTRSLLWLSGIFMGLALATKYLALTSFLILGVQVLWISWQGNFKERLSNVAQVLALAVLVASPWYLKNLIWTGDPFYPYLGIAGEVGARFSLWTRYMRSFGTGHGFLDYLFLPINVYVDHERFSTFLGLIEIPGLLFPLACLYPFGRRSMEMSLIAWWSVFHFITWAGGSQQIRFLLPLFPALSLLVAYVLNVHLVRWASRVGWILRDGLVYGVATATLLYSILFFVQVKPFGVIAGSESRAHFLERMVPDYAVMQEVQRSLPVSSRVMLLWDGRGYYCDQRCLADTDHARWTSLVGSSASLADVNQRLKEMGITHLLVNWADVDFILQHDPTGEHKRALDFFKQQYVPACAHPVYQDDWAELYEISCK